MKGLLKRIHGDNGGFTLIELVIVIAILGILMAIALPNFSGITDRGNVNAAKAELVTVQTAMDTMMAQEFLTSVDEVTVATDNMSAFTDEHALYPHYLRSATTSENYTCDSTGLVTQH